MKISIIVSTYNGEKYIISQLNSIKNQTRCPDEVLIFDDHSKDHTALIINRFIVENNLTAWHVNVNQINKGWRRNFVEGTWKATGDLIFTCDQDDVWRNDKLAVMEKIMNKHPDINLLASNYQKFFEDGQKKVGPFPNDKKIKKIHLKNNYLKVSCPGCTYCIRRNIVDLSKNYWRHNYAHDDLFWRLALLDDSLFVYTDYLIFWRKHHDSAYANESRALKTIKKKYEWINMSLSFNSDLKRYLQTDITNKSSKKFAILNRNDKWLRLRKRFFKTKNVIIGFRLLFFLDCYQRTRQFLGDWYLLFIKRK